MGDQGGIQIDKRLGKPLGRRCGFTIQSGQGDVPRQLKGRWNVPKLPTTTENC
jgi:hypothetical protein